MVYKLGECRIMMTNKEALIILDEVFYQGKYLLMDDPKFFEAICCAEEALKKVDEFPEVNNLSEVNNKYIDVKKGESYPVPIFVKGKYSFSTNDITPYVSASIGYTLDINEYIKDAPGLMIEPAFGVEFVINEKQFAYIQLGLNFQHGDYYYEKDVYDILGDWEIGIKEDMFKAISFRVGFSF